MAFPVSPEAQAALYSYAGCSRHKSVQLFLNHMWATISPAEILPGLNLDGARSLPQSSKPPPSSQEAPNAVFQAD